MVTIQSNIYVLSKLWTHFPFSISTVSSPHHTIVFPLQPTTWFSDLSHFNHHLTSISADIFKFVWIHQWVMICQADSDMLEADWVKHLLKVWTHILFKLFSSSSSSIISVLYRLMVCMYYLCSFSDYAGMVVMNISNDLCLAKINADFLRFELPMVMSTLIVVVWVVTPWVL
jgi:hypothetical protein